MRIVIVEDNFSVAKGIAYRLQDEGHAVDLIHDGAEAELYLKDDGADLVILDIKLPSLGGLEVLAAMRARDDNRPVLMLTAQSELSDKVAGLDAGADDYLSKPFEMDELAARIRALSRRRALEYGAEETIGSLVFDRSARTLSVVGEPLELPRRELAVFECLLERRGRLVSKAQLTDHVYGVGADVEENAVEPHISRLRKRLAPHGVLIKTARGLGYLLEAQR